LNALGSRILTEGRPRILTEGRPEILTEGRPVEVRYTHVY